MGKKVALLGMCSAGAILLGYVESLIPVFFFVPGMKLGLANLAVVLTLYFFGPRDALIVQLVRIVVVGFLFGNLFSIAFSLAGGCSVLDSCVWQKDTAASPYMALASPEE